MKKKVVALLAVPVIIALAVSLWFYGYFQRKNIDNIPSKELLAAYYFEKGEAYATEKLEGYHLSGLKQVWGEPDGSLSGMWGEIWEVDENTYITVYYRAEGGYADPVVDCVKVFEKE